MAWFRTILFAILFYGISVIVVLMVPFAALFGQRALTRYALRWARLHRWCARVILGITTRVEGTIPPGAHLVPAKHQSMFETTELALMLDAPAVVLKRELARIPVWGWAARRYGAIVVDRDASAQALRSMMREATDARASGRSVLIFPEGTRVAPGDQPPLKSGFAGLYRALDLPVLPVAMDSGRLWPRKGPKRAGVVTFRFGDVMPPKLARPEIEARVHGAINALD